jgi:NAD(P)-dependent dehydrogenase (short-subunit alcohol dehydrogenase family)
VVVVDLDPEAASAAAAALPGPALGRAADVTDRGAMQRVVAESVERFGGVDVVVAHAGIASRGATFRAMSGEAFDRVLDVNLNGVHRTVAAALPEIVARGGHVVVISSVYAFVNGVGATPYAMSKAGVEQLGRALRVELAQHGAGASVAYFGFIDTEMVHQALDEDPLGNRLKESQPAFLMKRLQPAEAGRAIVSGIERRAPRIIRPRRWAAFSVLRGIANPFLDRAMVRSEEIQGITHELDRRDEAEQTTTA